MIKFINKQLGVLEAPNNDKIIEQYRKRPDLYGEIEEIDLDKKLEANEVGQKMPLHKDYSKYTLKELKNEADSIGLVYNKKITRSEILALLEDK